MRPVEKPGYVLLIVLVALTITAVVLAQVATRSLRAGRESLDVQRSLQAKWGRISCQRALLPRGSDVFELHERMNAYRQADRSAPTAMLRHQVLLGGQIFDLILADEDAKASITVMRQARDVSTTSRAIRELVSPRHYQCINPGFESSRFSRNAILGWGEVFDLNKLRSLEGDDRSLAQISRQLTLWGSGRLNMQRASNETILALCQTVVTRGLAQRLIKRLDELPRRPDVETLLLQTVQNAEDRTKLAGVLSNGSVSYSLWVESTLPDRRRFQSFATSRVNDQGTVQYSEFLLN